MVIKWVSTEPQNFDDVVDIISRENVPFRLLTARPEQKPMTCRLTLYLSSSEATLPRNFLVKALHADNWQLVDTFEQWTRLLAGYYSWVWPEHVTKIEPTTKSAFEEGKAYYERNKDFLTRKYNGEYIAIWNNGILDHDTSFSSLAQRVYEKLGYVSVYMPFVTSKCQVLRLESAKYRRSTASVS